MHPRDRLHEFFADVVNFEPGIVIANIPQIRTLTRNLRKNRSGVIATANFQQVMDVTFPDNVLFLKGE